MSTDENALTYNFHSGKATVYVSVDPNGFTLDPTSFMFNTPLCFIYAETVVLANVSPWTLKTGGKTLGIFCNQLVIPGSESVLFDVSGPDGLDDTTDSSINGGDSGTFYLYVENITDPVFKYLNIRADGGNGGRGISKTDPGSVGGTGGNGGNGGTVKVVFGSAIYDIAALVHTNLTAPWPQQASTMVKLVLPTVSTLTISTTNPLTIGYQVSQTATWQLAASSYDTYATSLQGASAALAKLNGKTTRTGGHPSSSTKASAAALKTTIDGVLASAQAPASVPANTDYIPALLQAISTFMQKGGNDLEASVVNCINTFPPISGAQASDLSSALQDFLSTSLGLVTEIRDTTAHNIVNTNKGVGGLGGYSGPGTTQSQGNQGSAGTDGTSSSQLLYYNGSPSDSNGTVPFVFPEQCRKLLNLADSNYFVANTASWTKAIIYYERLIKRLSFLDAPKVSDSVIASALEYLVNPLGLTWNPLTELMSVYQTAQNRLSQLKLGTDMFGHSETWVPRLSAQFYKQRVETMLPQLTAMENAIATFTATDQTDSEKIAQCQAGISNAQAGLNSALDRIQLISGTGGLLPTYEYQILTTNPLLQPALDVVNEKLEAIEEDLALSSSLNSDDLMNAFSMLAMCPDVLMGLTEVGTLMYKTSSELTNNDNVEVNRKLVLQKVETCTQTLDSLNETFKQNSDGTIDLNDPAANLIFSSESNVDDLLQEFSKVIPQDDITGVNDAFKAYTDLVLKRNGYVTSYNTSLQLLLQAINDRDFYQQGLTNWKQQLANVDPNIPAILSWLTKNRDDLRLQIMQKLNYEARANRFWGLSTTLTAMIPPGPLQGAADLEIDQTNIDTDFENCLPRLADNNMNQWPAPGQSGVFYAIPDDVLDNLKNLTTPVASPPGTIYAASFAIANGDVQNFNSMANIRLTQVRLWLPGAAISSDPDPQGNQRLSVLITQSGDETIYNSNGVAYPFVHDPVHVEFDYFCNRVTTFNDCVTPNVFGLQGLSGDYNGAGSVAVGSTVTAPIGPYSNWTIQITSNAKVNPDLDLSNVDTAYIEFWGRSQASLQLEKEQKKRCKEQ